MSSTYYDPKRNRKHKSTEDKRFHRHSNTDNAKKESKSSGIYPRDTAMVGPTPPTPGDLQMQKGFPVQSRRLLRTSHRTSRRSRTVPSPRTKSPKEIRKRASRGTSSKGRPWHTCPPYGKTSRNQSCPSRVSGKVPGNDSCRRCFNGW